MTTADEELDARSISTLPCFNLTPRQHDVASLVAAGHGNREVARQLGLSPGTVRNVLSDVYALVGKSSRTVIALMFVNQQFTRNPDRNRAPICAERDNRILRDQTVTNVTG